MPRRGAVATEEGGSPAVHATAAETRRSLKITPENLESLVRAAICAPSPDNNQPWRFSAHDDRIWICHDRDRALPSDVGDMFSRLALGAAIENICLAARAQGCEPEVQPWVDERGSAIPGVREPVATISLVEGGCVDPLHRVMARRHTNRKPYARRPVAPDLLERLRDAAGALQVCATHWRTSRWEIGLLSELVCRADRIRFEYRPFHEELHRQLRLTPERAAVTGDGLDVRTLEGPPGTSSLLAALRPWRRMRLLNRIGLSRLLTIQSGALVRASGAIGFLSVPDSRPESFLAAGRALQRLWLEAESEGLSLHPLGSLPIFLANRREGGVNLTAAHGASLGRMQRTLCRLVPGLTGRILTMAFRIGYARKPRVRSLRRPVREVLARDRAPVPEAESANALPAAIEKHLFRTEIDTWSYDEAFSRNRGLVAEREQEVLGSSRVAIAGLGGVGGSHLVTMARLGVGRFTIADPDRFDVVNTNRQVGATVSTLSRSKAEVMAEIARDINPRVQLRVTPEAVRPETLDEFLRDADVVVDGLDVYAMGIRRLLFRRAAELGIPAVTAGPIGFSTAWLVFDPDGMSFDDYFDLDDDMDLVEMFASFVVGLVPKATHRSYTDLTFVNPDERTGPSLSSGCQLASGVAGAEVVKLLLGRGDVRMAPRYQQFDPYVGRFVKGKLRGGNRHPMQRLKRWWFTRYLRVRSTA
jgi:molybdopterin/thiamine biosynthesis adenylyltransferase/nitroreductase